MPLATYQQLAADGFITSEDLQLVTTGGLGAGIVTIFRKWIWEATTWLMGEIGMTWNGTALSWPQCPTVIRPILDNINAVIRDSKSEIQNPTSKSLFALMEDAIELVADMAGAPAIAALQFVEAPTKKLRNVTPGDQLAAAEQTFGRAWAMGEFAHLLAIISGIVPNSWGVAFSGWAAEVSTAAGFREIAQAIHRSYYSVALARPTAYEANKATRSLYPRGSEGQMLFARGLITAAQRDELDSYEGMNTTYAPLLQAGRYQGINPRQLIRLLNTGLFTDADVSRRADFRRDAPGVAGADRPRGAVHGDSNPTHILY